MLRMTREAAMFMFPESNGTIVTAWNMQQNKCTPLHWLHLFYFSPGCVFTASDMLQDKHPVSCLISGLHRCLCPQNLPPCLRLGFCSLRYFSAGLRYDIPYDCYITGQVKSPIWLPNNCYQRAKSIHPDYFQRCPTAVFGWPELFLLPCSPRPCCEVFLAVVVMFSLLLLWCLPRNGLTPFRDMLLLLASCSFRLNWHLDISYCYIII